MPEIDITTENRRSQGSEFDKSLLMKLKKGETARGVMLQRPTFAWCHTLRAPQIVNGKARMETKTRTDKNGEIVGEYTDFATDFIGRHQCLGDLGILADKAVDPANCPSCKASIDRPDEVPPPERRFAVNFIRYATNRDGKPLSPFSCSCAVWAITEKMFTRLINLKEEHGELVGRDLILGPCISEGFQNLETMGVGAKDVWKLDEQIKARVIDTFKSNRVEDLESAIARRTERQWILRDLDSVSWRWRIARGVPADGTEGAEARTLTDGLDDLGALLTGGPTTAPAEPVDLGGLLSADNAGSTLPQAPAQPLDISDLLGDTGPGSTTVETEANTTPATATATAPASQPQSTPVDDFDDLLSKL